MSKAFDWLDSNILIHTLIDLGVNPGIIALIDVFLSQRQCKVKQSTYKDITMGTPQGTWSLVLTNLHERYESEPIMQAG